MGSQSSFPENDRLTAGARPDLPPSLQHALGWLKLRLNEPIVLDDLAAAAGVRPRTLEAHFKLHLGTTPMGWVRRTRLARAHQQLLASRDDANVTEIANANGFTELGRFAAQYRRQFGELPSQTLKTSRGSGLNEEIDDEAVRLSWGALSAAFTVAPGHNRAALDDVERAQELAPHYALPKAIAAWCWGQRAAHGFSATPIEDRAHSLKLADEAARLAPLRSSSRSRRRRAASQRGSSQCGIGEDDDGLSRLKRLARGGPRRDLLVAAPARGHHDDRCPAGRTAGQQDRKSVV